MKKKSTKIIMVLLMVGILATTGTVFADSGISTASVYSGSITMPAYGAKKQLASGTRTTATDGVQLQLTKSTQTLSSSYPLYFRLRDEDGNSGSSLITATKAPYLYMLNYNSNITSKWYLKGQTDSKLGTTSTTISYTASNS